MKILLLGAALAAVGLTAAGSAGAVTIADPLNAAMFLHATSNIGDPALATKTDSAAQSWNGTPTDLATSVRAVATLGADSVTSHGSERATWLSADRGSVRVSDFGHEFDVSNPQVNQVEALMAGDQLDHQDWTYAFRATRDGVFNLDFDITGRGDNLFGLGAWQLEFIGDGLQFVDLSQTFHGTSDPGDNEHTGSFSHALQAGQTYRVSLINLNSLGAFSPNHQSATMDAAFDWAITGAGVPEPSSWALAILGCGLAGAELRRQRRQWLAPSTPASTGARSPPPSPSGRGRTASADLAA